MMETFAVALSPEEQAQLDQIELDARKLRGYSDAQPNGERVVALWKLLMARAAIPAHRLSYFTDLGFNPGGRGRSRKDEWANNGTRGEDVLRHPHFLELLRYFLFGADMPAPIIAAFREAVERCGHVTSSDVSPLGDTARTLARGRRLEPKSAGDEFYKLALDCGISASYAGFIREKVRAIRYTR